MVKLEFSQILSAKNVYGFLINTVPIATLHLIVNLPSILTGVMIGSTGDLEAIAVIGLGQAYFSLFGLAFVLSTVEITTAGCGEAFAIRDFRTMAGLFYKALVALLAISLVYMGFISFMAYPIFRIFNVGSEIAARTQLWLMISWPGYLLRSVNMLIQAYLQCQNAISELNYSTVSSLITSIFAGRYFILIKGYSDRGFAYSIILQEAASLLLNLYCLLFKTNTESLVTPSVKLVSADLKRFIGKNLMSLYGLYGEFLFWELNTILLLQLQNISSIAAWFTLGSVTLVIYCLTVGISHAFTLKVSQLIWNGHAQQAHSISIAYYCYTLCLSGLLGGFISTFAPQIAQMFINNQEVVSKLSESLSIFCWYLFPFLVLNTFGVLFDLLKTHRYLLKMNTLALPVLGFLLSLLFGWGFGLGYQGIIWGQALSSGLITVFFLYALYWKVDWKACANDDLCMGFINDC